MTRCTNSTKAFSLWQNIKHKTSKMFKMVGSTAFIIIIHQTDTVCFCCLKHNNCNRFKLVCWTLDNTQERVKHKHTNTLTSFFLFLQQFFFSQQFGQGLFYIWFQFSPGSPILSAWLEFQKYFLSTSPVVYFKYSVKYRCVWHFLLLEVKWTCIVFCGVLNN